MTRLSLDELPGAVVAFIEETLGGTIKIFENQTGGFSLGAAALVLTETGNRGFVKAIGKAGFESTYELYKREADILVELPAGGNIPRLLGTIEVQDWIVLVIEDVSGHHPRTPGEIVSVLDALLELPVASAMKTLPDARRNVAVPFSRWKDIAPNFRSLTDWARANLVLLQQLAAGAADAIGGDQLVHGDLRCDNVLIDSSARAWLVDWPWAMRGAQWFDALLFLLDAERRLDGIDADQILATHPVFAHVRCDQMDAVLAGYAAYYVHAAEQQVQELAPSLRVHQFECARTILGRLERRLEPRLVPQTPSRETDHNVVS